MAGYVGNIPVPQSVREDQSFTATAGQTTFNTLGYTDGNRIKVTLNGVLLEGGGVDYTATNGSDVVLTVAAVVDDIVRFETFNEVQLVSNTSTTPIIKTNLTLKNDTHEDTDGGRESTVIFSGEQSGGEITTLAEIEASHDGTADDQKGDLIFRTNDGSDGASPTEAMRIQSDQKVGMGTITPSRKLAVKDSSVTVANFESTSGTAGLISFSDSNTTNDVTVRAGAVGDHLVLQSGGAERMRIDSAGRLLIGTTTEGQNQADNLTVSGSGHTGITIRSTDSNETAIFFSDATSGTGEYIGAMNYIHSDNSMRFSVNVSERMRIASDGALLLSTTSNPSGGKLAIDYARGSSAGMRIKDTVGSGGTGVIADFYNSSNNSMGAITHDSSNITYGGTSDYRLKENINYTWDGITKVKELKPARFTWIDNPDVGIIDGFLAHEVSSVVPKAVVGQKDASETYTDEDGNEQTKIIPQQLDQSKLVPLLTKALQEAIAKIETLETKVAALEAE